MNIMYAYLSFRKNSSSWIFFHRKKTNSVFHSNTEFTEPTHQNLPEVKFLSQNEPDTNPWFGV